MPLIAAYPGTFDPITNGHSELIERAAKLFDQIIIGVAESSRKTPFLDLKTRLHLVQLVLRKVPNVKIEPLTCLAVDFAKRHQAHVILRGLRAVSDFDYEFQLAGMNRRLAEEIETVFLPAVQSSSYISATMVREIAELGGDVTAFVHPEVAKVLAAKR